MGMSQGEIAPECPKCAELLQHVEQLERRMARKDREFRELEKKLKRLQEQVAGAKKDSTNSSKPPSSDIVKPPRSAVAGQRRRGGQLGHAPQQRPPFELREIDDVQRHSHRSCPQCGGPVEQLPTSAQVLQQVELLAKPTRVIEHHSGTCHCPACHQDFTQPIPSEIAAAGTFGPRLTAWIAYLKGDCHASFRTIQKLLWETCRLRVAKGTLAKLCQKISQSLAAPYEELRQQIPSQERLNVDETSHRENGKLHWTWVFRAPRFTLFHIDPTRSGEVLQQILGGEFAGTLCADYFTVYRSYLEAHPLANGQFCLAHLIRDVKYLETLPDEADQRFSRDVLAELKALFRLWHTREAAPDRAAFRDALIAQGEQLDRVATQRVPETKSAWNIARRFETHSRHYLRFTRESGLEPTNNAAEQAIRQVVIDRRVTQGTRSERGREWCQRIWTTIATCRQHGRDLLSFLQQTYRALLTDTPPPALLPAS
jgi:transposase